MDFLEHRASSAQSGCHRVHGTENHSFRAPFPRACKLERAYRSEHRSIATSRLRLRGAILRVTDSPFAWNQTAVIYRFESIHSATAMERVYAGQVDPNDPSHFTIRYQIWGQEDIVDGRLDNTGKLTLKQRNPPKPPKN